MARRNGASACLFPLGSAPEDCALLLAKLQDQPGIARIALQAGASKSPEGDILTVEAANQASIEIVDTG